MNDRKKLKEELIKVYETGDFDRYNVLLIKYRARHHSKKDIIEKINYHAGQGEREKREAWEEVLKVKGNNKNIIKPSFVDILKYPYIKVFFWRGEGFVYVTYKEGKTTKLTKRRLKFEGEDNVKEVSHDWESIKKTSQYKVMTALGFKTYNGRTYQYDNGMFNVWVTFNKGKIGKLKVNDWLVNHFTFIPNKEYTRILIRKGLTFSDIQAYKGLGAITDKEHQEITERIKDDRRLSQEFN